MFRILFFLILFSTFQTELMARKLDVIIYSGTDTIKAKVNLTYGEFADIKELPKLSRKMIYYNAHNKKVKLYPSDSVSFEFNVKGENYYFISGYNEMMSYNPDEKLQFFRVKQEFNEGKIKLLSQVIIVQDRSNSNLNFNDQFNANGPKYEKEVFFVQLEDGRIFKENTQAFNQAMKFYFEKER